MFPLYFQHPEFSLLNPGAPNDLALLRLSEAADLDNDYISTVALGSPDIEYAGNPDCYMSGWGRNGMYYRQR